MKKLMLGAAVLALLVIVGMAQKSSRRGPATPPQATEEVSHEGVKTPQQVEHSKLYKEFKKGKSLREMTAAGDVRFIQPPPLYGGDPLAPPFVLGDYLRRGACDSDAVLVGTVREKASFLTDDERFVFSDHAVAVEEVLKADPAARLEAGQLVTVTRPGGKMRLKNARTVEIVFADFEPFRAGGRYVFFLRRVPSTGGYQVKEGGRAFRLGDDRAYKLTAQYLGAELESMSESSFLNEVRHSAAAACAGAEKGGQANE